jgi:shikimate kinase
MHHLRANGVLVFLDVDLATLEARVSNFSTRGLARRPEQSFSDLFRERHALYAKYADITVPGEGLTQERVCERIIRETRGRLINR